MSCERSFTDKISDVVEQVTEDLKMVPGDAALNVKASVVVSAAKDAWLHGKRLKNSLAQTSVEVKLNRAQRRAEEKRLKKSSVVKNKV